MLDGQSIPVCAAVGDSPAVLAVAGDLVRHCGCESLCGVREKDKVGERLVRRVD